MQISSQPYLKTYHFSPLSIATLLKLILLVISLALPFFLTYSTPNFYMSSHLYTNSTQPITYNYKYHIEITTTTSTYIYTNLFTYYSSKAIAIQVNQDVIQQGQENGVMSLRVRWSKSKSSERVTGAQISLFYNFVASGATQLGMAAGRITGYNIAEGSIAGILTVQKGTGQSSITSTNLTLNNYNLLTTQLQMTQSLNYLNYQYSTLPINLPSDMLELTMLVNYASYLISNQTPSVLGQLIWSWVQYFPIFLTIYWVLDKTFCFLLREKIVRSTLSHDQEYLTLISQQNSRRERLRQL